jgi:hypothetical protein
MALYQEANGLEHENFANFSFPPGGDDINQPLPIVDNILPQVPPTDHRAATDLFNTITALMEDLQKFQENLFTVHNLLSSLF